MTGRGLPAFIDPIRLAAAARELTGRIPLAAMHRLGEAVLALDGDAFLTLRFDRHDSCLGQVRGTIEARVQMRCQRCLQPAELELRIPVALGIVRSEAEAERLPGDLDPLLLDDDRCRLSDLVEDELLLALPVVAMHVKDAPECLPGKTEFKSEGSIDSGKSDVKRPFDVLASLKKDH